MSSITLTEHQWTKIVAYLRSCGGVYVGNESESRCFDEQVVAELPVLPRKRRFAFQCLLNRAAIDRFSLTAMPHFSV